MPDSKPSVLLTIWQGNYPLVFFHSPFARAVTRSVSWSANFVPQDSFEQRGGWLSVPNVFRAGFQADKQKR